MNAYTVDDISDLPARPSHKPKLPVKEADLMATAAVVCNKWKDNPNITLLWANAASFEAHLAATQDNREERQNVGAGRRAITSKLELLDKTIDNGAKTVMIYVLHKYGSETVARSHYAKFGIVKTVTGYKLPIDRNQRMLSLSIMIKGIAAEGFGAENYGTTFWTDLMAEYQALYNQAIQVDGEVSGRVSVKNQQLKYIREVLNAIIHILIGNYPNTYKGVMRVWGFQKNKY